MRPDAVRAFLLPGRRTGKLAVCLRDGHPHVRGRAELSDEPGELLHWATAIGGRYMGAERAEEYGRRNASPGELLVCLTPERVIAETGVAD